MLFWYPAPRLGDVEARWHLFSVSPLRRLQRLAPHTRGVRETSLRFCSPARLALAATPARQKINRHDSPSRHPSPLPYHRQNPASSPLNCAGAFAQLNREQAKGSIFLSLPCLYFTLHLRCTFSFPSASRAFATPLEHEHYGFPRRQRAD